MAARLALSAGLVTDSARPCVAAGRLAGWLEPAKQAKFNQWESVVFCYPRGGIRGGANTLGIAGDLRWTYNYVGRMPTPMT